jgi:hypothetical protein
LDRGDSVVRVERVLSRASWKVDWVSDVTEDSADPGSAACTKSLASPSAVPATLCLAVLEPCLTLSAVSTTTRLVVLVFIAAYPYQARPMPDHQIPSGDVAKSLIQARFVRVLPD